MTKLSLLSAIVLSACGATQQAQPTTAAQVDTAPGASSRIQREQVAEGELREALLALRRVHFGFDNSELSSRDRDALQDAASKLSQHPDVHLYVDGHTDERGTSEYNLSLGERRAHSVVDYLVRLGIDASRLHIMSFGAEHPLSSGRTPVVYARNRRAEFRLMRGNARLVLEEGSPLDDQGRPIANAAAQNMAQ